MGVTDGEQGIPPPRLCRRPILDSVNLMPKALTENLKGLETSYGDSGAGSVKLCTLVGGKKNKKI